MGSSDLWQIANVLQVGIALLDLVAVVEGFPQLLDHQPLIDALNVLLSGYFLVPACFFIGLFIGITDPTFRPGYREGMLALLQVESRLELFLDNRPVVFCFFQLGLGFHHLRCSLLLFLSHFLVALALPKLRLECFVFLGDQLVLLFAPFLSLLD